MSKKGFGKFLAGAGLGAAVALLFAPKKGTELRKDLKNKIEELINKAKELDKEEVKKQIEERVEKLKQEISELDKEKVLEMAKKKSKQITKSANNLVEYAIDKGTPVLEKLTSEVRLKAIAVTKDVLEKLEKEDKEKSKEKKDEKKDE